MAKSLLWSSFWSVALVHCKLILSISVRWLIVRRCCHKDWIRCYNNNLFLLFSLLFIKSFVSSHFSSPIGVWFHLFCILSLSLDFNWSATLTDHLFCKVCQIYNNNNNNINQPSTMSIWWLWSRFMHQPDTQMHRDSSVCHHNLPPQKDKGRHNRSFGWDCHSEL